MTKTILVTGGAGYIGSACVCGLIKDGHKVTVFDNFSTGQEDKVIDGVTKIEGDLLDFASIDKACASDKFDLVMHFAAKKAVGESEVNPTFYFDNNVVGSLNLLKAMEKNGIKQIVFSSTAAVYKAPEDGKNITENSELKPENVYGQTKLMVEEMIKSLCRTGVIDRYNIFRYFNVAGDYGLNFKEKNPQNVFPIIANCLNNKKNFSIFGTNYSTEDGTCIRDYIHLKDLVSAHIKAVINPENGIYNLGTGKGSSVKELVNAFNKQSEEQLLVIESDRRPGDSASLVADSSLAQSKLVWKPEYSLDDMVSDTLKVFGV
jgi:UDP-glucose 4-epimerase